MDSVEKSTGSVGENGSSDWTNKIGIARHLGVSERHITNLQKRRRIPHNRIGRCVRFNKARVDAVMRACEVVSIGSFFKAA